MSEPKATDGRRLPVTPVTLALATDPAADEATEGLTEQLDALATDGQTAEAHRLVEPLITAPEKWPAVATFFLREVSGKRGARLLLRWLRADRGAGDDALFTAGAHAPLEAWCHHRLHRHGRALGQAKNALDALPAVDDADAAVRDAARLWGQILDAMRCRSLRQGDLRLALNAHELSVELETAHPGATPAPKRAKAAMTAVAFLLDLHAEHGLPASLARYLARSLGHDEGDSLAAYAELVRDLKLAPEHLEGGLAVARRFGFADRVEAPLQRARERLFSGHWKVRRALQRAAVVALFLFAAVALLAGFTVLVHFLNR